MQVNRVNHVSVVFNYLSQDVLRGCANNKEIINLIEKWLIFFKRIFLLGYSPE